MKKLIPRFSVLQFKTAGTKARVATNNDAYGLGCVIVKGSFEYDNHGIITTANPGDMVQFDKPIMEERTKITISDIEQDFVHDEVGLFETSLVDESTIVCSGYADSKVRPEKPEEYYWFNSLHMLEDDTPKEVEVLADDIMLVLRGTATIDGVEAYRSTTKVYTIEVDKIVTICKSSNEAAAVIVLR